MADNGNDRRNRWQGFNQGGNGGQGAGGRNPWRFSLIYVAIAVLLYLLFTSMVHRGATATSFNKLQQAITTKTVKAADVGSTAVIWVAKDGTQYSTTLPQGYDPTQLMNQLTAAGADTTASQPSVLAGILVQTLIWVGLFGLLYFFLFRRMMGGGAASALNLGKNRVKIYDRKEMKTTFSDVAGVDEAVEELREIVEFLRNPKKYQRLGGRIPKGVLLLGPPGCGKTLLARAVAGEAAVPFFFMSGSEFVEMFVGLGAARVRELFQQAKEKAPCLVFLDELDTIGKSRAGGLGGSLGSHDEREQTLNQLLVEMDGFDSSKGVIIMAATNRADVLDPALVRPGRFDRQVVVDLPDLRGREAILKVHARGVALDPSVDLRLLASRTPGFTGADLENVVNEAALLAARRDKSTVTIDELEEAIDRTVAGLERKSRVLSQKEKRRVAVHEMGHALAALRCKNIDPVHRVTIIPRGLAALGMTMVRPLEDRHIMTKSELEDRMTFALGGRVAEELVFGDLSTGAADDLHRATEIARAMVVDYGMSEKLGPTAFGQNGYRTPDGRPLFPGEGPQMSGGTAQLVDDEVKELVAEARERAMVTLREDRDLLDRLSEVLITREVMEGDELRRYVDGEETIPTPDQLAHELAERKVVAANGNGKSTPATEAAGAPSGEAGGNALSVPGHTHEPATVPSATAPLPEHRAIPPRPD